MKFYKKNQINYRVENLKVIGSNPNNNYKLVENKQKIIKLQK